MKQEEWEQELIKKYQQPLFGNITRYQHIERLGHLRVQGLLDGGVIIQNKIDGANLSVFWTERGLAIGSRTQLVSLGKNPDHGFKGAVEFILNNPNYEKLVQEYKWVLRGEWLVLHSLLYDKDKMKKYYVFDVQDENGKYIHPRIYIPILQKFNIDYIPVLTILNNPSVEEITTYATGPDEFGAQEKEGIVIKRYNFVNKFGETVWAKLVSADFKVKNKTMIRATKRDAPEIHFASKITEDVVLKTIHKLNTKMGQIDIKSMPMILGIVWYDLFTEELWDFVEKNKVAEFNFKLARQLAIDKIRTIALAYFNGVL